MVDFLDCTTLYSFPPSYLVANQGLEIVGFTVDYGLPRWWFESERHSELKLENFPQLGAKIRYL